MALYFAFDGIFDANDGVRADGEVQETSIHFQQGTVRQGRSAFNRIASEPLRAGRRGADGCQEQGEPQKCENGSKFAWA